VTRVEYQRVRQLFLEACRRPSAARAAFLEQLSGSDAGLRGEVESLLVHDDDSGAFATAPFVARPAAWDARLPERIGRYRLLECVGRGGMATVYRAEQDNPRRSVALKLLPPELFSPERRRRLEFEAQLLGRLQHPGIAQIFEADVHRLEAGATLPYFAMEFVAGQPLTVYAKARDLDVRARLELLAAVCDAVQYAHQRGVIHRDLKPGNILVDERGQSKVLDFGIARCTDADVQATTMLTEAGSLVGTLAYMSPEQVAGDPHELDTRADVYALGVVAFELLTGQRPFDLRERSVAQALELMRTTEPARLASVAPALRGDLDTIVAKALAKDKTRRYAAASELAADLRRYLRDEPILARPPSAAYQFRKFARRNRGLVAGVALAFVALFAGVVGTTTQALRALRQRDAARAAEQLAAARLTEAQTARLAEAEARQAAERDAVKATQIQDFMLNLFESADPRQSAGQDLTVRQLLDDAAARLETDLPAQPEAEALLRNTLGTAYLTLGQPEAALEQFRRALTLAETTHGADDRGTLKTAANLAVVMKERGRSAEAEELLRRVHAGLLRQRGPEDSETLQARGNLANVLRAARKYDEAEVLLRETAAAFERVLGETHRDTLTSLTNLGTLYNDQRRYADAEPLFRRVLELHARVTPAEHPDRLVAMNNLGLTLVYLRRLDEAEPLLRDAHATLQRILGDEHPLTLTAANGVCNLLVAQERWAEAEPLSRAVVATRTRLFGEAHPATVRAQKVLRRILEARGQADEPAVSTQPSSTE
jgi:tetratricopeptide (TPR) repeat protein